MKSHLQNLFITLALLAGIHHAAAQGTTAFTYQGRLNVNGSPANGAYNLSFALFDASSGGNLVGITLTNSATGVTNGLFTVTLDYGSVFNGAARWLQMGVQTNAEPFAILSPRQQITPTPYAIYTTTATTANNFSGSLSGDVTGTQGATLVANAGGQSAANIASGVSAANAATSANSASTIVKRDTSGNLSASTITANLTGNATTATTANNFSGSLSGDVTGTQSATVVASVGGQSAASVANGAYAANAATSANTANAIVKRDSSGNFSSTSLTLAGNLYLPTTTSSAGSIYSGGSLLLHSYGSGDIFVGVNAGNLAMTGGNNTGIGAGALQQNQGGFWNTALGYAALAANTTGNGNIANGYEALFKNTIGGGNTADGVGALYSNTNGSYNIALGYEAGYNLSGSSNIDIGNMGVASDNNIIRIGSGQTSTFIAGVLNGNGGGLTNLNASQLAGGTIPVAQLPTTVLTNSATGGNSAVAVGLYTTASGYVSTALGNVTTASGYVSTALGDDTTASGYASTALGESTTASGDYSFAAGYIAAATNVGAFVWSGYGYGKFSSARDNEFAVRASGGVRFVTSGAGLTVDGPVTTGSVQMSGNVVMNDNDIQFRNDSYHGVGWYGGGKFFGGVNVNGPVLYGGSGGGLGCTGNGNNLALAWTSSGVTVNGTFNNNSDRNAKQNFASVKPEEVLEKVAQLPVTQWSYKMDAETRHIGPMAQDFYAAFAVGTDERHIAPIDEGGVALAAIQGLNEKVESGKRKAETQIDELQSENADLKARLQKLEQLMTEKLGGAK
jgi:hypothetical protein